LIFAVAIPMRKYFRGRMWLVSTNAKLDSHISDIVLRKRGQCFSFDQWSRRRSRKARDFLFYAWRRVPPALREVLIPTAHGRPIPKSCKLALLTRGNDRQNHPARQADACGHIFFPLDFWYVAD